MTNHELNCPQCNQIDKVQKVSALYTSGVSTVEYKTWRPPPPKSDLPPLLETRKGVSQTGLSASLAPPEKPAAKGLSCILIGVALLVVFSCIPVMCSFDRPPGWVIMLLILVNVAAWVAGYKYYSNQQADVEARMPQWEEAMRRWDRLYHCARCDGGFIPGEKSLIPIGRTGEFLFS